MIVAHALALMMLAATAPSTPRTMRVDYFHTGNATEERFSLDAVVIEPLAWPGNPNRPLDETNSGKYLFEIRDRQTNRMTYSRGFNSIYGEWETTGEAKQVNRTFHESLRFPTPASPVQVIVKKRDPRTLEFKEVWSLVVDPGDMFVDPSEPPSPGALIELQKSGDPAHKVDLLILGDGYTAAERGKFEKAARRLTEALFSHSPFKERRKDFNVWGLCPPSPQSGISRPSTGKHRRTRIGATYDAFGSERYVLTFDNRGFREVASFAPYEFVEILVNEETYGGGGIFNLYATVAADNAWAPYVFVHELGHHLGGLADEYFTSESAYESLAERPEPWEPNATALADPAKLKWRALVTPATPVPTSWDVDGWVKWQAGIQKRRAELRAQRRPESEMNAHFEQELAISTTRLASEKHHGQVGAFEGANYEAKGYFRPELDCVMFTRDPVPFCRVCQSALGRIIDLYSAR